MATQESQVAAAEFADYLCRNQARLNGYIHCLVRNLSDPVNLAGELGGMLVLGYLWRWCGLASAARRVHVWKTGMLVPVPAHTKALREQTDNC